MAPKTSAAAAAPSNDAYAKLKAHFLFYAEYHNNPVNQWIHIICVPLIFATALVFLTGAPLGGVLPPAVSGALKPLLGGYPLDGAAAAAAVYAAFYLYISPLPLGLVMTAWVAACFVAAHAFVAAAGASAMRLATIAHVVAWVAQFYGHGVHEGRSPALLDNLFQAIFMAPLFVTMEVGMKLGAFKSFVAEVGPQVEARIAAFKASKGGKKAK